ncbi:hypothetical protein MNBD_PLANCTO03-378 [hydrothermal vent metagenome]|uniref:Uncharacterized protein n=1 Tax=hydrothermal vent metagenome TaxID=652676 RepID=A0A3B1DUM2_9ZZZZ
MRHAMEGRRLGTLVRMATPICKAAQKYCPRTGPGHPFEYSDWQIAVLIFTAVLKRRKSKSSQYQYLTQHAHEMKKRLGLKFWPMPGMTTTATASRLSTPARAAPVADSCVLRSVVLTIRRRRRRTSRSGAATAESLVRVGTHENSSSVVSLVVV